MDIKVIDDGVGKSFDISRSVTRVVTGTNEGKEYTKHNIIPLAALGMYQKLLHCDSLEEAAKFIMFIRDNQIDTSIKNPWGPAYEQLAYDQGLVSELTLGGFNETRRMLGLPTKNESGISPMSNEVDRTLYLTSAESEIQSYLASDDSLVEYIENMTQRILDESFSQAQHEVEEGDEGGSAV